MSSGVLRQLGMPISLFVFVNHETVDNNLLILNDDAISYITLLDMFSTI